MKEEQIERIRKIVLELAEKSCTSFDAAFESAIGVMRYHAIDVVTWGKEIRACGSSQAGSSQPDQVKD